MTNPPADVIRQLLIDLGLGTDSGEWPVFVAFLPDENDQAICVYDTAGTIDGRIMSTGEKIEHPGIQIRVRAPAYPDAWLKATNIVQALDTQDNSEIVFGAKTYTLQNFSRTGAIIPLGVESSDRRRHNITINAITTIRER